jgi:hypothetical protein
MVRDEEGWDQTVLQRLTLPLLSPTSRHERGRNRQDAGFARSPTRVMSDGVAKMMGHGKRGGSHSTIKSFELAC